MRNLIPNIRGKCCVLKRVLLVEKFKEIFFLKNRNLYGGQILCSLFSCRFMNMQAIFFYSPENFKFLFFVL